ncbi:MAG TPA: hypothetical protein PKA53_08355 [Sphingobacterium sp.]|nr:hypothetical protein [Sphingobacterium sp.]
MKTIYNKQAPEELIQRINLLYEDNTLKTEEGFYTKLDEAIQQAEEGKVIEYTPELRQKIFGSVI